MINKKAAGAFMYIAWVDMVPELRHTNTSKFLLRRFGLHQLGLIIGGTAMFLLAKYEDHLIELVS